jgi:hypothetical protein
MDSKKCSKCNQEKLLCDYYKDLKGKLGVKSYCKACTDIETGNYRKAHLEKIRNRNKEFYKENSEMLISKSLEYYRKNKKEILIKRRIKYSERLNK